MIPLLNALKFFKITVNFLVGSVSLAYKGETRCTIPDDSSFARWHAIEDHFCRVYKDCIIPAPLDLSVPQANVLEKEWDREDVHMAMMQSIIEKKAGDWDGATYKLKNLKIEEVEIGTCFSTAGYDGISFPTATAALKYFIRYNQNLPEDAFLRSGEKVIAFTSSNNRIIQKMIGAIDDLLDEQLCIRLYLGFYRSGMEAPEEAASEADTDPEGGTDHEEKPMSADKLAALATEDLLEYWEKDPNSQEFKTFISTGCSKSMNRRLTRAIWRSAPAEADVFCYVKEVALTMMCYSDAVYEEVEDIYRTAATFLLARKSELVLSGSKLSKKRH